MKNIFFRLLSSLSLILLISCAQNAQNAQNKGGYYTIKGHAQGGMYSVTFNISGVNVSPETVRDSVQAILDKIDVTLSGYNKNSLLSRFNAGEDIAPNQLFLDTYDIGCRIYDETDGVVDVASAPLFDMWGFGFKTGEMPSDDDVFRTRENCGLGRCHSTSEAINRPVINASDLLIESSETLPQLNYNAIAQGYSCDLVAKYLCKGSGFSN